MTLLTRILYDPNGNVTVDPLNGASIAWNIIDLPRTLTSGTVFEKCPWEAKERLLF